MPGAATNATTGTRCTRCQLLRRPEAAHSPVDSPIPCPYGAHALVDAGRQPTLHLRPLPLPLLLLLLLAVVAVARWATRAATPPAPARPLPGANAAKSPETMLVS